jgi:hypothetical protein
MGYIFLYVMFSVSLGDHMKKLVHLFVIAALIVVAQVGLAANAQSPQAPQPVPPIIQPYPGPVGPSTGPVDPTPTQPPPS